MVAPGFDFADFALLTSGARRAPGIISIMSIEMIDITSAGLGRLAEVTRALAANAERNDRTADFPADGIRVVHQAGLLTATVARRYGGPGGGLADTARILGALGRGDPSVALISAMTLFTHAAQAAAPTWPDDVYRAALAESVTEPVLINALRVEPELGTPARGGLPKTIAPSDRATGWSVTGRKIFSTGAEGLR